MLDGNVLDRAQESQGVRMPVQTVTSGWPGREGRPGRGPRPGRPTGRDGRSMRKSRSGLVTHTTSAPCPRAASRSAAPRASGSKAPSRRVSPWAPRAAAAGRPRRSHVGDGVRERPGRWAPQLSTGRWVGRSVHVVHRIRLSLPAHALSRNTNFWIFPVEVFGNSANVTVFGALNRASLPFTCSMISASVAVAPSRRLT